MGRKITVDIAATGSVDGSFTSSMNQLQQAMKTVKTEAKGAGDSFTQLTRQVSQQRSALKSLQTEYAVMMATGDTAGANQMLEQVITMQGALEQNKSIVEGVRQAMQGLNNIDAETASSISRLTTEINQQETELQQLQSAYDQAVQEYGEGSQEAQKLQTEIQQLTTKLDANKQSLTQQMDAAKQMAQGYQQVNSATKQLQSTISKQKTDLNQLKQAFVETALKEGQTSQSARELGQQISQLSAELAANENKFREASDAADQYDQSLQGAEKAASSKSWKDTALGNLVSTGLTKAADKLGDFGRGIFTTGMAFESQMARVKGISGATDEQMADLTAAAKEWGGSTMYSAKEAGQALEYMALAGWDTEKSISSLGPVLKLASGAGMDLGQTSDLVTDFMGAFNKSGMTVQDFANKLVIASTSSNTSVAQMGEAFRNSAAGMNAMGQSVDTTSAVLSVLADNGIKGSRAGTQLSAIMRDMNHHMENGAIQIGKTSVAVADAQGNYRQLTDIIKDVDAATQGMSETERTAALSSIFTQDSQEGMFTLLDAQNGLLEDRQKLLANETMDQKALDKLYENQKNTFEYQWESFKGGVEDLQTSLFDLFKPAAQSVLSFVNDSVFPAFSNMISWLQGIDWSNIFGGIKDFFSNIWDSIGSDGQGIAKLGAGLLGGFAAFKGFGKIKDSLSGLFKGFNPFSGIVSSANSAAGQTKGIFASLGSGIKSILEGAGNAVKAVFEGIATLNIGSAAGFAIVVGSISLALAGLSAIGEPVLTFLHGLADVLLQLTGGLLEQFANFIQQVAEVFPQFCSGLAELSPLIESVGTAISTVIEGIGNALAAVLPALAPVVEAIGNTISSVVSTISDAIARVVEAIAPYIPEITSMIETISQTIGRIADDISNMFSQISPILDSVGNAFKGMGEAIKSALDGVGDIIQSVGDAIHSVFDGIADIIDSVGNAFKNAGKGFDLFAQGCQKLNDCNLLAIAGGLAAMLGPLGGLALTSGGMSGLGEGMFQFAQGLQLLNSIGTDFTGIISGVQNLVSQLQTAAGSMETIGPQMASACQAIVAGVNSLSVGIMAGVTTLSAAFASMISMFSTTFSSLVSTTSTGVQGVITALTGMTTGFSSAGTAIISIMSTVTTSIMNSCNRMRSTMQTTINSMVSTTNSGMSKIRSSVQSSFASIPGIVASAMNSAVASVQSGVSAMAAALSVRLEGPHIAVPHFSMSGSFDPKTGAVPTVSVSYYKKGGIMDGSTIFGQNGNRLMVGGEAGQEAILPLDPFWSKLDSFLEQLRAMMRPSLFDMDEASLANAIGRGGGSYVSNPSLVFNPTININGNVSGSSSISQQISDEIENQKQQLFEQLKTMMQEERERAFSYGF